MSLSMNFHPSLLGSTLGKNPRTYISYFTSSIWLSGYAHGFPIYASTLQILAVICVLTSRNKNDWYITCK